MKAAKNSPSTITVHVPLRFTARGNTKRIVSAAVGTASPARFESALIKAIARAHRWRRKIESGEFASITELANAEKVNQSYACRLLRLTLLSPEVITAILDGRLNPAPTVNELMKPFSPLWHDQLRVFPHPRTVPVTSVSLHRVRELRSAWARSRHPNVSTAEKKTVCAA